MLIYGSQRHLVTITLIIAEAAIETIPKEIVRHPSVTGRAERIETRPAETLLDRSYHHSAMKSLPGAEKRGRPDIVHFALMEALSIPLFFDNLLSVYVHTTQDRVISISSGLRVPKSYFRFEGLMMDLFRSGVVRSDEGRVLMELSEMTVPQLLKSIRPEKTIGLSVSGVPESPEKLAKTFAQSDTTFVVGGFPRGHFREDTTRLLNQAYSINSRGLEAHVVIGRILYECEKELI